MVRNVNVMVIIRLSDGYNAIRSSQEHFIRIFFGWKAWLLFYLIQVSLECNVNKLQLIVNL